MAAWSLTNSAVLVVKGKVGRDAALRGNATQGSLLKYAVGTYSCLQRERAHTLATDNVAKWACRFSTYGMDDTLAYAGVTPADDAIAQ